MVSHQGYVIRQQIKDILQCLGHFDSVDFDALEDRLRIEHGGDVRGGCFRRDSSHD